MEPSPEKHPSSQDQIKELEAQIKVLRKHNKLRNSAFIILCVLCGYTSYKYYFQGKDHQQLRDKVERMLVKDEQVLEEIKKRGKAAASIQGLQLIQGLAYFCNYSTSLELYTCGIFDTGHDGEEYSVRRDNAVLLELVYRTVMRTRIKAATSNSSWGLNEEAASEDEETHQYYYGYFYYTPEY